MAPAPHGDVEAPRARAVDDDGAPEATAAGRTAVPGFPPPTRLEKAAWCGFDFANSSFTTVIVTAMYPVYFANVVVGDKARGEPLWLWAGAASQLAVLLLAPMIGAVADASASKKSFLFA
ncbi:MAG TPA: hypothetical protein VEI02_13935, partial [Planctomycetota bacterium]|nr:hypothetical protein [Planctomycetota bacterium]